MLSDTHASSRHDNWDGERFRLNAELHARPFLKIEAPARLLHFAYFHGGELQEDRYGRLICLLMTEAEKEIDAGKCYSREQISVKFGDIQVKYQKHTEFSTLTLLYLGESNELFADVFESRLPYNWLGEVERGAMIASRLSLVCRKSLNEHEYEKLSDQWIGSPISRSMVLNGGAEAWTDFRIYPDGYSRFLLIDHDMREQQAGRLTQRLFEIETYAMAALLALPMARNSMSELLKYEYSLAEITEKFTDQSEADEHRKLLSSLSLITGMVEKQIAESHFRFSAASAYDKIIEQRIAELREDRIEGYVQFQEFMERRLAPAINLCNSAMLRQENLSKRLSRASQLLRASVDISMQVHSRELLASMNSRAQMQFHLQEMVEILSSVAVLYYGFGLVHGVLERLDSINIKIDEHRASLLSIPILAVLLIFFIRFKRKKYFRK